MGHQISKYPLTSSQLQQHKLPPIKQVVSILFTECGCRVQMFEDVAKRYGGASEVKEHCWACQRIKVSR